jgi:hypothetical protein
MRSHDASLLMDILLAPRLSPPTFVVCLSKMVALSPMQMACACYAQQPKVSLRFGLSLRNWLNDRKNQGFFRAFILFCNASSLARTSSKLKGLLGNISSIC